MRTYVISLDEPSTDLMQMLRNNTLDPTWVPGVNGKALTDEQIRLATTPLYSLIGPRSAIGIALAHMRAWYTIIKNNDQYALIVEDDVILIDDFPRKLPLILNVMPEDTDILALGCFGCHSRINTTTLAFFAMGELKDLSQFKDVNPYIVRPTATGGTHAYIVTNRGARKLLTLFDSRIHHHVDLQIQEFVWANSLRYYAVRDRIAFQTSTDSNLKRVSANVQYTYPTVVTEFLKQFYLDDHQTADYVWNISLFQIGSVSISGGLLLCAGLAFLVCSIGIPPWVPIIVLFSLSISDLLKSHINWNAVLLYSITVSIAASIGHFIHKNPRFYRFSR